MTAPPRRVHTIRAAREEGDWTRDRVGLAADIVAPLPNVGEGVSGMALIEAATLSQETGGAWTAVAA